MHIKGKFDMHKQQKFDHHQHIINQTNRGKS